jgi:putative heme iron utilization protein
LGAMSDAPPSPFSPEVVAAIRRHMNDDHADDNVTICRGLGGRPGTTAATMTGMGPDGIEFEATVDGAPTSVVIPWAEPITERAQVRSEVVRMHTEAAAALGLPPREH